MLFRSRQRTDNDFHRESAYAYHNWRVAAPLWLCAGVSYDHLSYPENALGAPLSDREISRDQLSPKGGFIWIPAPGTTVRGAYTRSLGGFSYDQSVRLEPTQVAGFNQAFRSLFPEALVGSVPGSDFETFHLGLDHQFPTRTYAVFEASVLRARGEPRFGVFDFMETPNSDPAHPAQLLQKLRYEERSLALTVNQLAGEGWSFGARYRVSLAELETRTPGVPDAGFVPYVLVDKVDYTDAAPWPSGAVDGGGLSLQRQGNSSYGNEPLNWRASTPTPGAANGAGIVPAPVITASPQSQMVVEGDASTLAVSANGAVPIGFQWRFNGTPMPAATNEIGRAHV